MPECSAKGNAILGPECGGALWEARRYFVNGRSDYRCERHAKATMRVNPFGARYVPHARDERRP